MVYLGSSLNGVTALCPWAGHINISLLLVQPRNTSLYNWKNCWCDLKNQSNKKKWFIAYRVSHPFNIYMHVYLSVRLNVQYFVWAFINAHTLRMGAANALARLLACADLFGLLLLVYPLMLSVILFSDTAKGAPPVDPKHIPCWYVVHLLMSKWSSLLQNRPDFVHNRFQVEIKW